MDHLQCSIALFVPDNFNDLCCIINIAKTLSLSSLKAMIIFLNTLQSCANYRQNVIWAMVLVSYLILIRCCF